MYIYHHHHQNRDHNQDPFHPDPDHPKHTGCSSLGLGYSQLGERKGEEIIIHYWNILQKEAKKF